MKTQQLKKLHIKTEIQYREPYPTDPLLGGVPAGRGGSAPYATCRRPTPSPFEEG